MTPMVGTSGAGGSGERRCQLAATSGQLPRPRPSDEAAGAGSAGTVLKDRPSVCIGPGSPPCAPWAGDGPGRLVGCRLGCRLRRIQSIRVGTHSEHPGRPGCRSEHPSRLGSKSAPRLMPTDTLCRRRNGPPGVLERLTCSGLSSIRRVSSAGECSLAGWSPCGPGPARPGRGDRDSGAADSMISPGRQVTDSDSGPSLRCAGVPPGSGPPAP